MAERSPERGEIARQFGSNLRHYRGKGQLSQEQVAFLAELHRTEISLLERGERVPRIDTLVRLAAAVSVPPADLLAGIFWERPTASRGQIRVVPREDG